MAKETLSAARPYVVFGWQPVVELVDRIPGSDLSGAQRAALRETELEVLVPVPGTAVSARTAKAARYDAGGRLRDEGAVPDGQNELTVRLAAIPVRNFSEGPVTLRRTIDVDAE